MVTRFYYVTGTCVIVGVIAIVSFCLFYESVDPLSEEKVKKRSGPFISEFLGLSFQGQFAFIAGENARLDAYHLTEKDRERAVNKLQDTLQNTTKVSVAFYAEAWHDPQCVKEELLFYDVGLIAELHKQVELVGESVIPTLLVYGTAPAVIFTLHPSEVRFNVMPDGRMYVSLGKGVQRWEGSWKHFTMTLLDARFQNGETVRSVAAHVLNSFDWSPDKHAPESDEPEVQD